MLRKYEDYGNFHALCSTIDLDLQSVARESESLNEPRSWKEYFTDSG